ncbi:MAG: CDP-alcohol phosphatidyltransferase family protein, partial [Firmicutes bacterium]|nr:CDP-alcohol phosphatidyltransferase family protein [Bacillota bacterium]
MSVVDWLTASRVLLTVPVLALWLSPGAEARWWGLAVFVLAGLTDFADGRLARRLGRTTRLGAYLDPLADKVLVLGTAAALVAGGRLSAWVYLVVLVRELA